MTDVRYPFVDCPAAWKSADLPGKGAVTVRLAERHLRAFDAALERAGSTGLELEQIERSHFPLGEVEDDVVAIREEVLHGRGIVILDRIPLERYGDDAASLLFWGLGTHLGCAVSQSLLGDRLGHVVDVSGNDPAERGYRSSKELKPHTDADDMVAMMCLRKARSGGVNRFSSAIAIYNELASRRPDLLEPLSRGFRYHWRGEQAEGEPPITEYRIPVLSRHQGLMSCVYLRAFIEMAAHDLGQPLTRTEVEALDAFDALAGRDDMRLDLVLEPGEIFLVNNYTVLHSRTAFEDHEMPDRRRHLLRMWLKAFDPRPVVPAVRRFYSEDGITARPGGSTRYSHPTDTSAWTPDPIRPLITTGEKRIGLND